MNEWMNEWKQWDLWISGGKSKSFWGMNKRFRWGRTGKFEKNHEWMDE